MYTLVISLFRYISNWNEFHMTYLLLINQYMWNSIPNKRTAHVSCTGLDKHTLATRHWIVDDVGMTPQWRHRLYPITRHYVTTFTHAFSLECDIKLCTNTHTKCTFAHTHISIFIVIMRINHFAHIYIQLIRSFISCELEYRYS